MFGRDESWKLFISWLKYNNIFSSFCINFNNKSKDWESAYFKTTNNLKLITEPYLWIQYAFRWCDTKQGDSFWAKKSNEWEKYYNNTKIRLKNIKNKKRYNYGRMFIRNY